MTTEGHHPHPAPDRKPRRKTTTKNTVGRAARPASLAFPLRPASSRGDRGPRAYAYDFLCGVWAQLRRVFGLPYEGELR
jgi:hypothetical protein